MPSATRYEYLVYTGGLSKRVTKRVESAMERTPKLDATSEQATKSADAKLDEASKAAHAELLEVTHKLKTAGKTKAKDDPVIQVKEKAVKANAKLDGRATVVRLVCSVCAIYVVSLLQCCCWCILDCYTNDVLLLLCLRLMCCCLVHVSMTSQN